MLHLSRPRARLGALPLASAVVVLAACGGGDSTSAPVPSQLQKVAGDQVQASVAAATPSAPTVKVTDEGGRAIGNVIVNFAVNNGGTIVAAVDTTGADGLATAGAWTLGTTLGQQTVTATSPAVAGVTATFTATAVAGPAQRLVFTTQPPASAQAGVPFQGPVVEIRDAFGNRANSTATVTLNVATAQGTAGQLTGTTSVQAVNGVATFGQIAVATTGAFNMSATSPGLAFAVSANAIGVSAGAAAGLEKVVGDVQLAGASGPAFLTPVVRVVDALGNAVAGEPVTFSVVAGGGSVTGAVTTSDANGLASPARWILGPNAGANTLRATTGTATADFAATAAAPNGFNMELRYVNTPTRRQQDAFEAAWLRWRNVVTGDLPGFDRRNNPLVAPCQDASLPTLNELVDDLIVYVNLRPIDGQGAVLGSAGPCALSGAAGTRLMPYVGVMTFDTADLPTYEANGQLDQIIVHEMGHVLGIGSLWGYWGFLIGGGSDSSSFDGALARGIWQGLGGLPAGSRVPVENCVGIPGCGQGTRDGHWRESVFDNELMTGYIDTGRPNPLSALTIRSLEDVGYQVDISRAEGYALPGANMMAGGAHGGAATGGTHLRLIEGPAPAVRVHLRDGRMMTVEEYKRQYPQSHQ